MAGTVPGAYPLLIPYLNFANPVLAHFKLIPIPFCPPALVCTDQSGIICLEDTFFQYGPQTTFKFQGKSCPKHQK